MGICKRMLDTTTTTIFLVALAGEATMTESGNFAYTPVSIFVEMVYGIVGIVLANVRLSMTKRRANMLVTPK